MLGRYSDLQERFRLGDGYSIELKTATVLQGLGFKPTDHDRATETFSGGWQMRLALAKLLLRAPNLLLLDEPTNHLDLEARNWLEEYLNAYPHAVILVSHDRFFLDAVVTRIADLTLRTLTDYVGNYSALPGGARGPHRADAKSQARTGRRSRARQDVHRSLPLPGDQGLAGAEPDQDAREGRADRSAAGAQEDSLRLPGPAPRAAGPCSKSNTAARPTAISWSSRISTCTSSAAIALRWSARTASASRR